MKFIFDENLSLALATGMRAFGEDAQHIKEHPEFGSLDEEWLPAVGDLGWIVVTRDLRIRHRPAELKAHRDHDIGSFVLGGKSLNRCSIVQMVVRNWPKIKELSAKSRRPFMFRIPPNGKKFVSIPLG